MVLPVTRVSQNEGVQVKSTIVSLKAQGQTYHIPTGLFIDNLFRPSVSGKMFPIVNPATGKELMHFYEADKADVDVAVAAAQAALPAWRERRSSERGVYLQKLACLFERDIQELAELESLNNGKPLSDSLSCDIPFCIDNLRYYAGWSDKNAGQVIDADPKYMTITMHEPYGVVGQIVPWNFPLACTIIKMAPALATGNTIVLKSSEKTPLTAMKLCQLVVEAGFPAGVVNVLSGYGPTAGDAIARHPGIAKVAFTGSTATGRKISIAAAESNLKKVTLELGGKSPNIVFADADLSKAVQIASDAIFGNAGQVCIAGSRLFLHEDIYDTFIKQLTAIAENITTGPQFDTKSVVGPLVDRIQYDRVRNFLDLGIKEGATMHCGGCATDRTEGFYVKPTIFTNVSDDMRIAKEEIFGPVVCVFKFRTMEEVMQRANDTSYGLGAAIHTKDLNTAMKAVKLVQAGTVWVNSYGECFPSMPFGGFKQSGNGRDNGEYAIQEYTQVKAVYMKIGD